ncbi:retrovirus-related pol polyprotein from transposon TNT 1-94 [Tanacetum coccineum]
MSTSKTYQQSLADAGSETRPPMLERGSYIPWASRFRRSIYRKSENQKWLNKALDEGPYQFQMFVPSDSTVPKLQIAEDLQGDALLHYDAEMELMNLILLSIPNEIYNSVDACTRLSKCGKELNLMNDLERNKMIFPIATVNIKFLNSLQSEWLKYVTQVRLAKRLTVDSFDDLFDYLQQFEKLVNASRAKKLEKSHDPLALVTHTGSSSKNTSSYYVTHPTSVVDYDDEYQQDDVQTNSEDPLASAMLLLARDITQNFSNLTNNRLRTSSNTRNQAIIQGDRVNIQSRNSGNTGRNARRAYVQEEVVEGSNTQNETGNVQRTLRTSSSGNTLTVQCYSCSGKGHYARNCPKPRLRDSKYFMEQMLLAKQDEAGVILTDEHNDFLFADASRMEEIEELSANICLMARIQPANNTSDVGPSYDSAFISEQLARNAYLEDEKQQLFAQKVQKQNTTLTNQLELYKERVRVLENINGDNNYLNEFLEVDRQAKHFNQQAQSQFIRDRDIIHDLEKQRDLEAKLKKNVDLMLKLGNSLQGMIMLGPKPLSVYDPQLKHGLGYSNPYILKQAISQCPKLYLPSSLSNSEIPLNVRDTEDTHDDSSKNFVPQNELSAEQKYFPSSFIPSDNTSNATSSIPASMPTSLKHEVEISMLLNHECEDNSLHAELEQVKKNSIEIQVGLQEKIKILEKDVQRCQKQSVDFELKLQHAKEKHKWESTLNNKNTNPLDYSWISKMEKLENENVSLDFTVQSLMKERDNVKIEYQKLFDSIKKTQSVGNKSSSRVNTAKIRIGTCYVRNLEGDDLLTGGRESNLYTISISDMAASSPVCLMSKATSTKSWLWHRRLSHLNFGTINRLDLVDGLPKFKYGKDHLCSACERGKSKKASHPPKLVPSDHSKLELLHMDLCGPMRASCNNIQLLVRLSKIEWLKDVIILLLRLLEQCLSFLDYLNFFGLKRWLQLVLTQNRSIIHTRHNKTPYELLRGRKPNVEYFHVFGSLCYPTNDRDDLGKMKPKANIGVFIGYSETSKGFRIYNRRTKKIMETIHVKFDELTAMASEHDCLEPVLQRFNNNTSSADTMNTSSKEDLENVSGLMFEEYFETMSFDTPINSSAQPTQFHKDSSSTSSIIIEEHEAPPIETTFDEQTSLISLTNTDEVNQEDSADFNGNLDFVPYNTSSHEEIESSTAALEPSNVQNFHQV